MKALDLFSGIGGFALGFERAGIGTSAFCEISPYARRVLKKHWPDTPIYNDVREINAKRLRDDGITVDIVCGGFPCQDISLAGNGIGLAGARSGLWWEMHRIIAETKPQFAVVENVSALRSRGLDTVLRAFAEIGYDAEWHCIPAAAVGAPHRRDRIWIVAYPNGLLRAQRRLGNTLQSAPRGEPDRGAVDASMADTNIEGLEVVLQGKATELATALGTSPWAAEPDVGRVAYGVPSRVDRLQCLGNAVVPQIPEIIGRAILARSI